MKGRARKAIRDTAVLARKKAREEHYEKQAAILPELQERSKVIELAKNTANETTIPNALITARNSLACYKPPLQRLRDYFPDKLEKIEALQAKLLNEFNSYTLHDPEPYQEHSEHMAGNRALRHKDPKQAMQHYQSARNATVIPDEKLDLIFKICELHIKAKSYVLAARELCDSYPITQQFSHLVALAACIELLCHKARYLTENSTLSATPRPDFVIENLQSAFRTNAEIEHGFKYKHNLSNGHNFNNFAAARVFQEILTHREIKNYMEFLAREYLDAKEKFTRACIARRLATLFTAPAAAAKEAALPRKRKAR